MSDTPVVRVSGMGQKGPIRILGDIFTRNSLAAFLLQAKGYARRGAHGHTYVGCLLRDDNSIALFAADQVDKSAKLDWVSEDYVRSLISMLEAGSESDQEPTKKRSVAKLRSVSIEELLNRPVPSATVKVGGDRIAPGKIGAELIRRMRAIRGMSRSQLAQRLSIAPSRVAELELGDGPQGPTLKVLADIANACEVDLNVTLRPKEDALK